MVNRSLTIAATMYMLISLSHQKNMLLVLSNMCGSAVSMISGAMILLMSDRTRLLSRMLSQLDFVFLVIFSIIGTRTLRHVRFMIYIAIKLATMNAVKRISLVCSRIPAMLKSVKLIKL